MGKLNPNAVYGSGIQVLHHIAMYHKGLGSLEHSGIGWKKVKKTQTLSFSNSNHVVDAHNKASNEA